jgi:hypothetical protein
MISEACRRAAEDSSRSFSETRSGTLEFAAAHVCYCPDASRALDVTGYRAATKPTSCPGRESASRIRLWRKMEKIHDRDDVFRPRTFPSRSSKVRSGQL